jgi:LPXTG-motif cell wall-anchored protein
MKIPFLFISILLALGAAGQKKVAATVAIDKNRILIGEQAQLMLQAVFPPKNKIAFFQLDSLPHFEILFRSEVDTVRRNDSLILSQRVVLTSWDSGTWQIPALRMPGNRTVQTKALPVTISFSSPFDPEQEYHGIKDIIAVPKEKKQTWWWYVVIGLLLLGLFLLLFPKKKKQQSPKAVVTVNAYEQALKELEQLHQEPPADHKQYYTRLIDIFRAYLLQRKGIHSFQKTTDDLGRQLRQLGMDEAVYRQMIENLQLSDFVKFARYVPAQEERVESVRRMKTTIQHIEQMKA